LVRLLDASKGYEELRRLWEEVVKIGFEKLDQESFIADQDLADKIRSIIRGKTISYRYALITQLLAKVLSPGINALALQKRAELRGSFDARSFCKNTVVVFEKEYLENILGGSHDPYVSKPLRHEVISLDVTKEIKDKEGWRFLYEVLKAVQDKNDVEYAKSVLKQALLEVRRLLIEASASGRVSVSKSPTLTELNNVIGRFLAKPSGGARAQAIVYALLRVVNKRTSAFKDIKTAKSTVADSFSGRLADVECIGEGGKIKVAISVTEILDAQKLKEELDKSIQRGLDRLILVAHEIKHDPQFQEIMDSYVKNYKIDIIVESITKFVDIFTTLLNDKMREEFILEVFDVLKELGYKDHIIDWSKALKDQGIIKISQQGK